MTASLASFEFIKWYIIISRRLSFTMKLITLFLLLFKLSYCLSIQLHKHTFLHRVKEDGYVTSVVNDTKVKINKRKVFTSLVLDGYCFRRKDIHGKRGEIGSQLR